MISGYWYYCDAWRKELKEYAEEMARLSEEMAKAFQRIDDLIEVQLAQKTCQ